MVMKLKVITPSVVYNLRLNNYYDGFVLPVVVVFVLIIFC